VQSLHETYRFAKLKSWAATTDTCTFKVSKDEDRHKLQKEVVVYSTEMVSSTCVRIGGFKCNIKEDDRQQSLCLLGRTIDAYDVCCCGLHWQAEDICKLLKDYALWLAAKRKKEKAAKKKAAERAAAEAAEGGGD
jgi:hypothetical protein